MGNQRITLAIFGNQNSNSGFQPLYWINNPPQQLENLVPAGMEENPFFFVVETTASYTQFTLIRNHVSSYMSVRAGVLKIAITIPAQYKVAGDISPYTILLRIQDAFISECMTQKSQLSTTLNFKEELADNSIFSDIVNSYELIPAPAFPQCPMTGTVDGVVLLPSNQIAELFKCVQYREFESCRKVIVAESGNTNSYEMVFTHLQIPLKPIQRMNAPQASAPINPLPQQQHTTYAPAPAKKGGINVFDILKLILMPLAAFVFGLLCTWGVSLIVGRFTGESATPGEQTDTITKTAVDTTARALPFDTIAAKADTIKVDTPKVDTPKAETPEVETPKVETPKVETPKVETPADTKPKAEKTSKPAPVKKKKEGGNPTGNEL